MQQGSALQSRLPSSDHGYFLAREAGQVAMLRAVRYQAPRPKALLPCGVHELLRDVSETVQSARHHHDVGEELPTIAEQQAESAPHPVKSAYL
jgi:hypothetical protein